MSTGTGAPPPTYNEAPPSYDAAQGGSGIPPAQGQYVQPQYGAPPIQQYAQPPAQQYGAPPIQQQQPMYAQPPAQQPMYTQPPAQQQQPIYNQQQPPVQQQQPIYNQQPQYAQNTQGAAPVGVQTTSQDAAPPTGGQLTFIKPRYTIRGRVFHGSTMYFFAWSSFFMFMLMCAMMTNKLSIYEIFDDTYYCGWKGVRNSNGDSNDYGEGDNKQAGSSWLGLVLFVWLLYWLEIAVVLDYDMRFMPCCPGNPQWHRYVHCGMNIFMNLLMLCAFGSWSDQNECNDYPDGRFGPSYNITVFVWLLHLVYCCCAAPQVEARLCGPLGPP